MKILMVCLGNICRSPMAEGIMRHVAKERGLNIMVDSAGTAGYHIGEAPDPRMQRTAQGYNLDIENLRGRQFQKEDFDTFDLVFAMDRSNYNNILSTAGLSDHPKLKMILDELEPGNSKEVPDPYYGGDEGFENVYQMLYRACNKIADKIENGTYG